MRTKPFRYSRVVVSIQIGATHRDEIHKEVSMVSVKDDCLYVNQSQKYTIYAPGKWNSVECEFTSLEDYYPASQSTLI